MIFDPADSEESIFTRTIEFNLFDEKARVILIAIGFIVFVLLSFLVLVPRNQFKFSLKEAKLRMAIYG